MLMGAVGITTTLITATGGATATPGDGYKYHTFGSPGSFVISDGNVNFDVMLQGGGGGGTSPGAGPGNSPGGAGGGGGATGVWSAPASAGTFPVTVGGASASSRLTNTDASGYIDAGGGGPSTSSNSTPWSAATIAVNLGGTGGGSNPGGYPGGSGKPAGGVPQPNSLWWRPYISPGTGGAGGPHSGNATAGNTYGGGGGGGSGGFDGGPAGSGAAGTPGRVVIRYSV